MKTQNTLTPALDEALEAVRAAFNPSGGNANSGGITQPSPSPSDIIRRVQSIDPYTDAFLRYLGQEVDDLAGPIAASYPRLGVRDTAAARQIIHTTFVSVAAYLARIGGPITEPTLAFWKCIENSLALGCGAAPSSIEKIREFFNRVTEAKTPLALNDLALSDLRLLPALQQYDAEHGTRFAERARMLIWRFATLFVGADAESTPDEESFLAEFRQALDGRTAWTLLDVLPDNLALLKQLKETIADAKDAIETAFIQAGGRDIKNVEGDGGLANCLRIVAIHLAWRLGDISDEQVRFYRDFTWFFDKMSCHLPTDNLSYWRRWLEEMIRDPNSGPVIREPSILSLDWLKSYDSAHATNHVDRCRAMFFRFANAFVKADGEFSDADREALEKLKALLYPPATAMPVTPAVGNLSNDPVKQETKSGCPDTQSADTLMRELQTMVGLDRVKTEVAQLVNFLKVQQLRKSKGLPGTQISRHLVFMGNPGTGKTTIARLLASIYKALGILSKGHLVETERSGLVAGYLGQTAIKVQEIITTALGGVLFIDEAYALVERADDSFGQEAIDTLLKLMEDRRDDLIVVVAGYTEKMTKFLSSNPGMKSRFNKYITFEDYSPDELVEIFEHFCSKAIFRLTPAAKEKLEALILVLHEGRDETFGNGRLARNLFEAAINKQATRIVAEPRVDEQTLSAIEPPDIPDLSEVGHA